MRRSAWQGSSNSATAPTPSRTYPQTLRGEISQFNIGIRTGRDYITLENEGPGSPRYHTLHIYRSPDSGPPPAPAPSLHRSPPLPRSPRASPSSEPVSWASKDCCASAGTPDSRRHRLSRSAARQTGPGKTTRGPSDTLSLQPTPARPSPAPSPRAQTPASSPPPCSHR